LIDFLKLVIKLLLINNSLSCLFLNDHHEVIELKGALFNFHLLLLCFDERRLDIRVYQTVLLFRCPTTGTVSCCWLVVVFFWFL